MFHYKEVEGVPKKYLDKIYFTGNIINKEIFDISEKHLNKNKFDNFGILILGGSQAAKVFAEVLPNIF